MKPEKTDIKKIITFYVLIMLFAFVVAFLTQYILKGTNLFEDLGLLPKDKCLGSLSISNSGCLFKAKISMNDCLGKTYEVKEGSCSGDVKCEGSVDYDFTQSTCDWEDSSGNHNYVLCIGNKLKDSVSKTC